MSWYGDVLGGEESDALKSIAFWNEWVKGEW